MRIQAYRYKEKNKMRNGDKSRDERYGPKAFTHLVFSSVDKESCVGPLGRNEIQNLRRRTTQSTNGGHYNTDHTV